MGWLKKIAFGIIGFFVLLVVIGVILGPPPETKETSVTLPNYEIYNLEFLNQPNAVRIEADVVIDGVTLQNKAEIIEVSKEIIKEFKSKYNAEVIWLRIYNGTKYLEKQKGNTIADVTWFAHGTNYRPHIPKEAEKVGDVSGGEFWIDWKENWHDWGI